MSRAIQQPPSAPAPLLTVTSRQRRFQVRPAALLKLLSELLGRALSAPAAPRLSDLSLVLADDGTMAELNQALAGHAGPTDVLAVGYEDMPGAPSSAGEVFVNVERAWQEGARRAAAGRGWDAGRELALYIAHGCDHLAGGRDADPRGRAAMRRRERRWVEEAAHKGLLEGLLTPRAIGRRISRQEI